MLSFFKGQNMMASIMTAAHTSATLSFQSSRAAFDGFDCTLVGIRGKSMQLSCFFIGLLYFWPLRHNTFTAPRFDQTVFFLDWFVQHCHCNIF